MTRFTIGRVHALTMTATPALAIVGVAGGSSVLAGAGLVLGAALLLGAPRLLDTERSRGLAGLVHAVTLLVLALAVLNLKNAQIDSVLVIVMLGIFNRFLLRAGHRDDFLVIGMSGVLMAAATTITPGIVFFFTIALFLPTLFWALWSSMLLGAAEREAGDAKARVSAVKRMAQERVPSGLTRMATYGLGLTLAGYLVVSLLPRYNFSRVLGAGYFMTLPGATSEMQLRNSGASSLEDSTPVLRVEPKAQGPATLDGLYARIYALDRFEAGTFKSTERSGHYPMAPAGLTNPDEDLSDGDGPNTVRVTQNRLLREREGAPHPVAVLGRQHPSLLAATDLRRTMSGTWTLPFRGNTQSYKVELGTKVPETVLPPNVVEHEARTLLELPPDLDPRIKELGLQLSLGKTTDREKIDAIMAHFGSKFSYSLGAMPGRSEDPLARFLFEAHQGHCELYAAAAAVLLRVAGVRTRVATGYYGGKWNTAGGYLVFTQADAHAWVEAYDSERGWIWLDGTPPSERVRRVQTALGYIRDWYEAAEAMWFDHVIDFDETRRRGLVRDAFAEFKAAGEWFSSSESSSSAARTPMTKLGAVAMVLVLLGLAGIGARTLMRRRRPTPEALGERLRRALGATDDVVTLGVLRKTVPEPVADEAKACVQRYETLRFGPEVDGADLLAMRDQIARLEQNVRRHRQQN